MNVSSPLANAPLKMPLRRKSFPHHQSQDRLNTNHPQELKHKNGEDCIPQRPFRRLSGSTIRSGQLSTIGNISILSPLSEAGDEVVCLDTDNRYPRKELAKIDCNGAPMISKKDVPIKKPGRCASTVVSANDDSTITTYYTTIMIGVVGPEDEDEPPITKSEDAPRKKWLDTSYKTEDSPPQKPTHCGSVTLDSTSPAPPRLDETSISSDMHAKETQEEDEEEDSISICNSLIKEHRKQKELFSKHIYTLEDPSNYKAKEQPNIKTPTVEIGLRNATLIQRKQRVEKFWTCMNQRDYKGALDQCTAGCNLVFRGYEYKVKRVVPVQAGLGRTQAVIDAIPDFTFKYSAIEESCYVKGTLVALDFICTGHHTGCTLNLPPLPPIPVSNKYVVLDEAEQHYYFDSATNKISRIEEIALGETCGLMGVYVILSRP